MSSWTAASSDCSRPVNNYVHVKTADLYRPNARLTPERQGYQVLTPFGKLGYSPIMPSPARARIRSIATVHARSGSFDPSAAPHNAGHPVSASRLHHAARSRGTSRAVGPSTLAGPVRLPDAPSGRRVRDPVSRGCVRRRGVSASRPFAVQRRRSVCDRHRARPWLRTLLSRASGAGDADPFASHAAGEPTSRGRRRSSRGRPDPAGRHRPCCRRARDPPLHGDRGCLGPRRENRRGGR